MTASASPLTRLFRFLGRVQFTTILLLGGVVIMTVGTIIESRGSREIAWSAVYGTAWFDLFLLLIGINLILAVVNRIPIRRHQWPFVLTHFAIVILLAGAWISRTYGYEGRLMIYEGSEESWLYLDASEIRARWQGGTGLSAADAAVEASFPLPLNRSPAGRTLQEAGEGRPAIRIAEYLPDGVVSPELGVGPPDAPPGIAFALTGGPRAVHEWLIAGDPRFGRKDLGPIEVEFRRAAPGDSRDPHGAGRITGANVHVAPIDGSAAVHIPVPERVGEEIPCGPGVFVRVEEFFFNARVVKGKLSENAATGTNPAAVVTVRADGRTEVHTIFAHYPDFNSVRGRESDRPLVAALGLEASSRTAKPRIAILLGPDDQLRLQLNTSAGPSPAVPVEVGQTASVTALGLGVRPERLLANARAEFGVTPAPPGSEAGRPYVRVETSLNGSGPSLWLERAGGWRESVLPGGGKIAAAFAPQRRQLPFAVALEEFEVIHHPGSTRPAEYRSRVQVRPAAADLPLRDAVISMNRPLDVAGFRLFQSSYILGQAGKPDATILTVAHDPGVPIVYVSFVLVVAGIAWGLRGVRPKAEHAASFVERNRATPGAERVGSPPAARSADPPPTRRAGARNIGLLLAALAGLASAADAWAQPAAGAARMPVDETRGWAILADGRVKPLLTYANEITLAITGREHLDGLSSLEILWGYALNPREFKERPYVRVDGLELKKELGLEASERRFSFNALLNDRAFQVLAERALQRSRAEEPLTRLEDDALEAYAKLDRIAGLASGSSLTIVPSASAGDAWRTPAQLEGAGDPALVAIRQGFGRLAAAYAGGDAEGFRREARELSLALRSASPAVYPSESDLARELFYEDFNAFGKAWVLYLVGFLVILLLGFGERPWGYVAGVGLVAAGFVCHTVGLGTRWAIADRAPVSDMYESLVFMGWGAILFGLVAEAWNRKRFLALSAGLTGFICLAFAENLPINSAINPLVPVLAHTYWLSVHVMTVMLSYSAFALAMVIGHVMIFVEMFQREKIALLSSLSKLLYKTLQVGVLFLAAGIIFGAVWANESWGRYWGWDPKETWSLITFFVYLAIIHARFAGWLRHFGLAATAILGFLAVVMTYYGVNFILAAGLHSYGFSEGGQFYVALYAVIEIAIVVAAYFRYSTANGRSPAPVVGHDATGT